jgi:hypothetical protein
MLGLGVTGGGAALAILRLFAVVGAVVPLVAGASVTLRFLTVLVGGGGIAAAVFSSSALALSLTDLRATIVKLRRKALACLTMEEGGCREAEVAARTVC